MIVMDTCAIIWDALDPKQMTAKAMNAIDNAEANNRLMIADISIWEITMLIKKKRLEVDTTAAHFMRLFLQSRNVSVQPISPEIAELSVSLGAEINNDTADRIIAATAIIHSAKLVTADNNLIGSDMVDTLW